MMESRKSYCWNDGYLRGMKKETFQYDYFSFNILYPNCKMALEYEFKAKNYENALKQAKRLCKKNGWTLII